MTSVYNIYPTLFQCFGIILVGYLTGRLKFITTAGGKGISLFISNIALPALIFKAMVEVKFAAVDWLFWCALLISKAVVFLLVFIVTLIFQKTDRFGAAGLYSIFVSQSNDIAFGLPLCTYLVTWLLYGLYWIVWDGWILLFRLRNFNNYCVVWDFLNHV